VPKSAPEASGEHSVRVLVVEDARALADVLVEGLRDQGMAVDVARDGLEAAAKLDVNGYDVVVLDRDLPGIHGDTLCQMITERDQRVMVLMLTAAGSPGDRVSGLGLGADDYLAKPFHFPELVARIRALARRQPSVRARVLRAAGIELDPMRRTITRDGRQLDLSVKEFGVLEALLRARPGFLSTEDLLEQVWDEQADPFTNTVTVTIGRLRRKLGDPPVIMTTPTVGYRIADRPAQTEPTSLPSPVNAPGRGRPPGTAAPFRR
jgi:DNA-binding response OmpR family regulator